MSSTKVTSNKLALLAITIVIASLLILINQGKTYKTRTPSTFISYIDYFEEMYGVRYRGDIIFVEHHFFKDVTEERSGGLCVRRWFGKNTIYIDQLKWELADTVARDIMLLHLLGHCAAGLDHMDEVPGIMHSKLLTVPRYLFMRDYYLTQLGRAVERARFRRVDEAN